MRRVFPMAGLAIAILVAGCAQERQDDSAEAERLMQTSREWAQAASTGHMAAVLGYFADDAVLISAGQQPVRGRDALRAYLAETSKIPGFRIRWEPIEAKVSGDMGYLLERTQVTMNVPDGQPVTENFQAVTIWRKQPDGAWKNVVDATVPAAPDRSLTPA